MQGVSHISIGVRDMERSLRLYRDVLGLKVHRDKEEIVPEFGTRAGPVERASSGLEGAYDQAADKAVENDGGFAKTFRRRGVFLRWKDTDPSFVVLSQRDVPEGQPLDFEQVGINHFGFWVDNVDELSGRLKAAGVKVLVADQIGGGAGYAMPPSQRVKTIIFADPDGTIIQLDELLP